MECRSLLALLFRERNRRDTRHQRPVAPLNMDYPVLARVVLTVDRVATLLIFQGQPRALSRRLVEKNAACILFGKAASQLSQINGAAVC